jgi:hypothetical protein
MGCVLPRSFEVPLVRRVPCWENHRPAAGMRRAPVSFGLKDICGESSAGGTSERYACGARKALGCLDVTTSPGLQASGGISVVICTLSVPSSCNREK